MSHTAEVVTYKARRLKARASTSGVVAFLFAGGATSTIIWSVNGLAPWVAATGIVLSLAGATIFGVKAPMAYRRFSMTRELNALQHIAAVELAQFPDRSDHELRMASLKDKDIWARLENKLAGGGDVSEEYIMRLYEMLERINGSAWIRYSEASGATDAVSSWKEARRLGWEFIRITELTANVRDIYQQVLLNYSEGEKLDISLEGAQKVATRLATSPSERIVLAKQIINELRYDDRITPEHCHRLHQEMNQLEPLMTGAFVSPSRRRQAELDYFLIEIEIDAYATDQVFEKLDLGRVI